MFNRKPMVKKKQGMMEAVDDPDLSFSKIMKDVQLFASSHMTWKDKKALENQKVTGLGGKPQRKQRLPLSVARVQMKKQKEREEKTFEQNVIFGQFGGTSRKKPAADKKRKPEERVLKSTFGNFRGGVLDVKDLLRSGGSSSRTNDRDNNYGKNKNKSKGMGGELGGKASNIC
ncbi:BnaA05g10670D [Brassica napus]|uniref:BnaA05g10670D protein n=1 Tax=Brassica napus TaxID=3708 RepID=A0A078FW14_BRANA|nr:BnaA05g10670D [Brassica napus]